jgi:hypothetical protein
MSLAPPRFSIEGVVLGRNDDYEPDWTDRLYGSLRYNRELLASRGVDYRVAFVEWNPPQGKPLLAPALTKEFPFLRAIIIDAAVHAELCTADDLTMMLNFAYNPALRTSTADYCLITSGDLFFGRALADRIATGLEPGVLYRAERVNIREELGVMEPVASVIEDPANIVSVNTCTEPPYDEPPYRHACGDFLLVDRVTMAGLRGFDESIRFARLHLDSRFAFTAMRADLGCELLGRIYHINHGNAYSNLGESYPGRRYDYDEDLPYINPPDWGLARMTWAREDDRTWRISLPRPAAVDAMLPPLTPAEVARANDITRRLIARREAAQPSRPRVDLPVRSSDLGLQNFKVQPEWPGARIQPEADGLVATTVEAPWGYSAWMRLSEQVAPSDEDWGWIHVRATALKGSAAIAVLQNNQALRERLVPVREPAADIWLPVPRSGAFALMVRNAGGPGASQIRLESVKLVSQQKAPLRLEELLLSPR